MKSQTPRGKAEELFWRINKEYWKHPDKTLEQVLVVVEEIAKSFNDNWHKKMKNDYEWWRDVEKEAKIFCSQLLKKEVESKDFQRDDKVIFRGKIYDFGYKSATGNAIIYNEGERNMQDAIAVNFDEIKHK